MKKTKKHYSLNAQIGRLVFGILLSMCCLMVILLGVFIFYSYTSSKVSHNITDASNFSISFKDSVDQKMYYCVIDSEYNSGPPMQEIDYALSIAGKIRTETKNRDSLKAINSVINLCENLKLRIADIEGTKSYTDKMQLLESNVYILTELIQNYMYTYLYYEAGELAKIQSRVDMMLIVIVILALVALVMITIATSHQSRRISKSIAKPIDELYDRVLSIGGGDLSAREPVMARDERIQALSTGFEEMVKRLVELMELNKQEVKRIEKMELSLLQAQINPHFLYNTLETIIWLIETGKNEQAVDMVSSLSNFFRASLSKGRDVITLREEQIHAKSYLEIQQVRYRDILSYTVDIDADIMDFSIPKLTLQPLIENALYHGIKLKRGGGSIAVTGHREDNHITLCVADTGIGMNADVCEKLNDNLKKDEAKGFGMSAVYKRLKLMYGDDCDMVVRSTEGCGTQVQIIFKAEALIRQTEVKHEL